MRPFVCATARASMARVKYITLTYIFKFQQRKVHLFDVHMQRAHSNGRKYRARSAAWQ